LFQNIGYGEYGLWRSIDQENFNNNESRCGHLRNHKGV